MPKNEKYSNDKSLNWNTSPEMNPDLQASLGQMKQKWDKSKKIGTNPKKNELFELIYGTEKIFSSNEKEKIANQFFADLFDGNNLNWTIKVNDQENKELSKLLSKYLSKTDFATKLWQTKFKSGEYGNYALLILKEIVSEKDGIKLSRPNLLPVRIIYKNVINEKVFETEVEFEGYNFSNGKSIYNLHRKYSLKGNKVTVDSSLVGIDGLQANKSELNDLIRNNLDLKEKQFAWDFLPLSILKNNYDEIPRAKVVESKMLMLNNYDETLAILPAWEKGSILFNGSPVIPQNQQQQNLQFMKDILFKGFVQMKPIDMDGQLSTLAENVIMLKPQSIMQTVKATRDLIWMEIKEDLGLPSMNEVKSAQKSSTEIVAKQFLTSPIIEREKTFMKSFLKDLAKKFLVILSECEIEEQFPTDFDVSKLEIDVDFEITTDKNIQETMKQINAIDSNEPIATKEETKDESERQSLWKRIFRRGN